MENCRPLYEYAWFVHQVQDMVKGRTKEDLRWILPEVFDAMPEEFFLKRFLKENAEAVMEMFASNMTIESLSEDQYEAGRQEGLEEWSEQKQDQMLSLQHAYHLAGGMRAEESVRMMSEMYGLSEEEILSALDRKQTVKRG